MDVEIHPPMFCGWDGVSRSHEWITDRDTRSLPVGGRGSTRALINPWDVQSLCGLRAFVVFPKITGQDEIESMNRQAVSVSRQPPSVSCQIESMSCQNRSLSRQIRSMN